MSIFFTIFFFQLTSSALGAERVWTEEEIRAGQPGECAVRSEIESAFKPIFEKMRALVEMAKNHQKERVVQEGSVEVNLKNLYELISDAYFIVEDKNECPGGWPIQQLN